MTTVNALIILISVVLIIQCILLYLIYRVGCKVLDNQVIDEETQIAQLKEIKKAENQPTKREYIRSTSRTENSKTNK